MTANRGTEWNFKAYIYHFYLPSIPNGRRNEPTLCHSAIKEREDPDSSYGFCAPHWATWLRNMFLLCLGVRETSNYREQWRSYEKKHYSRAYCQYLTFYCHCVSIFFISFSWYGYMGALIETLGIYAQTFLRDRILVFFS